ncbi:glycosyl transferase [Caulobacter segnis]|uniref:Glycosyl transferase n=2 Tax=Caulobacter segnis TaxID=88688 RepID=D5VLQ9_CAUST|nr:hypothetical protein [Caulobacter segnis]ADG11432.1 conserved hypothetical protein [Caulobacter segnis ATCC 21756]AVQ03098.1 glycosyl transferase [Caulobacter segnis]
MRADHPKIGFLFLGGVHQALHIAPIAAALAREGRAQVSMFAPLEDIAPLTRLLSDLECAHPVQALMIPAWLSKPHAVIAKQPPKLACLLANRSRFEDLDVLVAAERTSTALKAWPGPSPKLVHVPHGAGDRARGFERRIRRFDHVIVSGPKDQARMIAQGLVSPATCSVSGSVKVSTVLSHPRMGVRGRLFTNDRPVVLYNPHFDAKLSSWASFGARMAAAFREQDHFNLVIAPHVRLSRGWSSSQRARFEALALEDRILVDAGSDRSHDMTYTMAADIYVGDVSSQVYEFLARPRPCVFLDRGVGARAEDPSFAFWSLGELVADPSDVLAALTRAHAVHARYRDRQVLAVEAALGRLEDATRTAADTLLRISRSPD